jgi:hypothetical protein
MYLVARINGLLMLDVMACWASVTTDRVVVA